MLTRTHSDYLAEENAEMRGERPPKLRIVRYLQRQELAYRLFDAKVTNSSKARIRRVLGMKEST